MPMDNVTTSPAVAAKIESLTESLAAAAESSNNLSFAKGLASLVQTLTAENARLNAVLHDETAVPPRQPLSLTAVTRGQGEAFIVALDHLGGLWQHRIGSDHWERLPRLPTPSEAEEQSRQREEADRERLRISRERGW